MKRSKNDILGSGRYKLENFLGEGSYGVVWLATDLQLEIDVAIKTLHPHMGKIADLQKEAITQARLSHPNIAIVYSVDIDDRFIAMEYVDGESLENFLRNQIANNTWVEKDQAVHLLSQCFLAVMHAHEQSVVHGDIKPGNIMLDQSGSVKITDFGVAKVISEEKLKGYTPNMTRKLGSTTYMAPEVLRGEQKNSSNDIFSLGVVSYLLFTGHHPFYNTHPSGLFGLKEMLLADEEAKDPREIAPDISESHANIILRLLSKSPECRYGSVKEAYEDFVGIGLLCTKCDSKNPANAKFCNQCGNSLDDEREDQYRGKTPQELWSKAFQLNGLSQFEEAIQFSDEAIKKQHDCADAHQTKAFALSNLGRLEDALASYEDAINYTSDATRLDRSKLANIYTNMSYCYSRLDNHEKAKGALEKALELDPKHYKARDLLNKGFKKGYW